MKKIINKKAYAANDRKIEAINAASIAFGSRLSVTSVTKLDGAYDIYAVSTNGDVTILVWFRKQDAIVDIICW